MKRFLISAGLVFAISLIVIAGWMCGGAGGDKGKTSVLCRVDDPENAPWLSKDCDEGEACIDSYCMLVPDSDVEFAQGDYDEDTCQWLPGAAPQPSEYACLGNNPDPAPGSGIHITGKVKDFASGDDAPVGSAKVYVYSTSDVSQAPACTMTSDITDCASCPRSEPSTCGDVNANKEDCKGPENSRFAYKVTVSDGKAKPGGDVDFGAGCNETYTGKDTYQFNILNDRNNDNGTPDPVDDYHSEEFLVISKGIFAVLPAVGQVSQLADHGIIGGAIWDCNGDGVRNAVITLVRAEDGSSFEEFNNETTDPKTAVVRFFRCKSGFGVVPAFEGKYSDPDGLFSIFNVPVGNYIIKAYGRRAGVITLLGSARVSVFADSISIANIEPCRDPACTPIGQ